MKKLNENSVLKYLATFYCAVFLRALCGPMDIVDILIIAVCSLLAQWLIEKILKR